MEQNTPVRNDTTGNPPPFALHTDAWGRLVLTDADGRQHAGVEAVRAFPISAPRYGVGILDGDGRELVWIDDLDRLPEPARGQVEEALARREFLPVLRRVVKVSSTAEPSEWEVETDRGPTRFLLNSAEEIRRLPGERAMITDAHGGRYLIEDVRALDAGSRHILERYL